MQEVAIIRNYLKQRQEGEEDLGCFPFVTISRQAGCRSLELAEEICRQMGGKLPPALAGGWEVFDQKLCGLIADEPKLAQSLDAVLSEDYRTEIETFIYDLVAGTSRQYAAYKKIFAIVRALGLLGKTVIVGRGGAHVAADLPLGVHIRLVGSEKTRMARLQELMSLTESEARRKMRAMDEGRRRLVKSFFSKDIDDPLCYDAVFNIDRMSPVDIAAVVVDLAEQRLQRYAADG